LVRPFAFEAGRVKALETVPPIHSDVGSRVRHLVEGAEVVMQPLHNDLVCKASHPTIGGKDLVTFGRSGRFQLPNDELAVTTTSSGHRR
jgi:hypothetical protein